MVTLYGDPDPLIRKRVKKLSCVVDSSHLTVFSSGSSELEEVVVIYALVLSEL